MDFRFGIGSRGLDLGPGLDNIFVMNKCCSIPYGMEHVPNTMPGVIGSVAQKGKDGHPNGFPMPIGGCDWQIPIN